MRPTPGELSRRIVGRVATRRTCQMPAPCRRVAPALRTETVGASVLAILVTQEHRQHAGSYREAACN